jgi:hypothetical protein
VDLMLVALRLVHIVCGVFWAGALIFMATFFFPSVNDAGPDGGKVVAALQRRGFLNTMPAIAVLTVLSGLAMFWRLSGGFQNAWMKSPTGTTLSIGALAAIVALVIGLAILRPRALRVSALMQELATAPAGPDRDAKMSTVQALRASTVAAGRWIAVLLVIATACMAVARYI